MFVIIFTFNTISIHLVYFFGICMCNVLNYADVALCWTGDDNASNCHKPIF